MKQIFSEKAPRAIGPYCHAIKTNNMLFISGQLGINHLNNEIPDCVKEQTKLALQNLNTILEEANYNKQNVAKCTIFLADLTHFQLVNEIYEEFFEGHKPARSCFEVSKLPKDALVEIEAIAVQTLQSCCSSNCK